VSSGSTMEHQVSNSKPCETGAKSKNLIYFSPIFYHSEE